MEIVLKFVDVPSIEQRLDEMKQQIASLSRAVTSMEHKIMVTLAELQTKADEQLARITAETDIVNAVKAVVDNQNANIAALKQQIADLIAAGSASTADLQRLSDTLDQMQSLDTANAQVVADAVAAGTPAATP